MSLETARKVLQTELAALRGLFERLAGATRTAVIQKPQGLKAGWESQGDCQP